MKIKKFFEMFEDKYDYSKILNILKKKYNWGDGIISFIDDFESDIEYFMNPLNDDDYIEQFHVYLVDKQLNRGRGKLNTEPKLRLGKWKGEIEIDNPTSIYNKLY